MAQRRLSGKRKAKWPPPWLQPLLPKRDWRSKVTVQPSGPSTCQSFLRDNWQCQIGNCTCFNLRSRRDCKPLPPPCPHREPHYTADSCESFANLYAAFCKFMSRSDFLSRSPHLGKSTRISSHNFAALLKRFRMATLTPHRTMKTPSSS